MSYKPITIIDAENIQRGYFKNLVKNRELFCFLAWRDIIVRYKQAFFGVAWALFRPLLNMLAFTLLFNRIAHLQSGNINYALFVFAGMLPWQFFSGSVIDTSHALLTNASLITKAYFPRMLIPLAQLGVHFLDFIIGFSAFLILMPILGELPGVSILMLPLFFIQLVLLTSGVSLWFSAITVQFRDLRFIVPFLIQFGIFVSPVGYPSHLIPEKWLWLFFLNPLVGIIDGFRFSFFGQASPQFLYEILISWAITLLITLSGYFYFRNKESSFADFI